VPGSPLDPRAAGTNRLIKQGATLVTEVEDILAVVGPIIDHGIAEPPGEDPAPLPAGDPGESARDNLSSLLGPVPATIDDLVRASGLPAATVRIVLLEMELAGRLHRDSAGRVSLA
jgi:DNA processing protein